MLNWNENGISDPFESGWFLRPLNWLADIATQAGQLPPLDDGNKHSIRYANLMRWNASYSNSSDPEYTGGTIALDNKVGTKFAWIYKQIKDTDGDQDESTILTEIAIPKATTPSSSPLPAVVGNTNSSQTGDDAEQQAIVRHTDSNGNNYYLLVNGESEDAISRGEGHEQADQLQLLYYVNGTSYLMDSGYDHGDPKDNSTWNKYSLHNVFHASDMLDSQDDGLPPPYVRPDKLRKVSEHNWVDYLYSVQKPGVTTIYANVLLDHYMVPNDLYNSEYNRKVLFIKNDQYGLPPFIIDINSDVISDCSLNGVDKTVYQGTMQYASDTRNVDYSDYNGWIKLTGYSGSPTPNNMYVFLSPIEWKLNGSEDTFSTNGIRLREVSNRDIDPEHQSGYLASAFSLSKRNAMNSCSWSTISIFQLSNSVPSSVPSPLFSYPDDDKQREVQAWSYSVSSNVIDVVIKRGKVNGLGDSQFNNDITFTVPQANNTSLKLPGGKDFGFARLIKEGNFWIADPDYQINLQQLAYFYTSSTSIGDKTFTAGYPVYVDDNVTLALNGNANMSNTTVHLGKDAYLKVSGSLTADDVVFTSNNPDDASKRYAWVELDGSSEIENCTFTGGQIGLVQQAGTNNYVRNSTFIKNNVGIRTSGGTIKLEACKINNNTWNGLEVWGAHVYTDQIFTFGQTLSWKRTHITGNGQYGIDVRGPGTLDLKYTRVSENGTHEIMVRYGGWLYAGVTQPYIYNGYNRLTDNTNTGYYLKNLAYTTDGETYITNTAWAQMNYWGGGAPPAGKIYGAVQWDPYITQDSTIDHSTSAYSMNNQNIEAAINLYEAAPTNVLTMATTDQIVSDTTNGFTADELLWAKQRMMDLKEAIAKAPNDRWNIRRVQEWYHLARRYDVKNKWGERTGVNQKLEDWQEQMETWAPLSLAQSGALQTNNLTGGSASIDNKLNANIQQAKTVQLMGEASLLLSVDELLSDGKVKEALDRSSHVISKLENNDSKSILYAYQLGGWQQLGRYDSSYEALERIKALQPDPEMTEKITDADFKPQEKWLLRLMKENNQNKPVGSAPAAEVGKVQQESNNLPKEFALDANYPNPFNPTTTVPISLPKAAHVRVEVYNVAGQLVATLANKDYQAGRYQLRFDAHMLASGMYLVRAHLGGKVFTRKLTLIK